jgi:hypothetical protein
VSKKLDQDLIEHACDQLGKIARRHVREGMGPESAARAAIRETRALFPPDWNLGVQGGDDEEQVEVWEVEHKRPFPIARVSREPVPERPVKLTTNQLEVLHQLHLHPRLSLHAFPPALRKLLPKLEGRGLVERAGGGVAFRGQYQLTDDGARAYEAVRTEEDAW